MTRLVNLRGYGVDSSVSGEPRATIVVESAVPPTEVSGEMGFNFGVVEMSDEQMFAVLAPDQSVLGAMELSESAEALVESMVDRGEYRVVVEFVEEIPVESDSEWFEMREISVSGLDEGEDEVYVEDARVEGAFEAQLRSLLSKFG